MNYIEEQFQGLLETVALFEDIAAVAAAPMNGGVICDTAFGNIDGYFDNMFKVNRDKVKTQIPEQYHNYEVLMTAINLTKLDNLSGVPLLTVLWCDDRDNIPPGFGPADGQLLPRSVFPDAFTRVSNSPKRVISDAAWLADPLKRGKYTLGDGSTNFRVPDLNGKQPDSIGALYLRGDGKNAGANPGDLQGEMIGKHDHNTVVYMT